MVYTPPTKIEPTQLTENFDSGQESLNTWLKLRALKNERDGASRTYVVCENNQVIAYYSIATGSHPKQNWLTHGDTSRTLSFPHES